MGQIYDQSYQYSIADLTYFGLRDHSDLVLSICDGAAAEHALESHLRKLTKKWELAEFKLMKHYQNEEKLAKQEPGNKNHKLQVSSSFLYFHHHVVEFIVRILSLLRHLSLCYTKGKSTKERQKDIILYIDQMIFLNEEF